MMLSAQGQLELRPRFARGQFEIAVAETARTTRAGGHDRRHARRFSTLEARRIMDHWPAHEARRRPASPRDPRPNDAIEAHRRPCCARDGASPSRASATCRVARTARRWHLSAMSPGHARAWHVARGSPSRQRRGARQPVAPTNRRRSVRARFTSPSHRRRASRPASWSDARRRQFHERLATRGGAGAAPTTARTRAARSSPGEARAAAAGAGQPRHTFAGASGQQTAATLCVPARRAADGVDGRSLHRRAGSNANVDVKVELGFRGWELAGFRSAENTRTRVAGSWRVLS